MLPARASEWSISVGKTEFLCSFQFCGTQVAYFATISLTLGRRFRRVLHSRSICSVTTFATTNFVWSFAQPFLQTTSIKCLITFSAFMESFCKCKVIRLFNSWFYVAWSVIWDVSCQGIPGQQTMETATTTTATPEVLTSNKETKRKSWRTSVITVSMDYRSSFPGMDASKSDLTLYAESWSDWAYKIHLRKNFNVTRKVRSKFWNFNAWIFAEFLLRIPSSLQSEGCKFVYASPIFAFSLACYPSRFRPS